MKHIMRIFGMFLCVFMYTVLLRADDFDYDDFGDDDTGEYSISSEGVDDGECQMSNIAIDAGAAPATVGSFDIAGIMLGMDFDEVQMLVRENGLYANRPKNSVVYSIHPDWKDNLDYECRQQKIYAPNKLEKCINSLARNRGLLYASELHLVRDVTGETIDVYFTSNATDNVVWKIDYKNDIVDDVEGDAEKFAKQRDKKIMTWWQNVLDKYGNPNAGSEHWASSDNAYDPLMTANYGELVLIDCGRQSEDSSMNVQQSEDNFAGKPYAF